MNPLVSIIIPAYNASRYLAETMASALAQSWPEIELIIINDGSTDDTEAIINSFDDQRIKYLEIQNSGQCIASNVGISMSSGDYIKFLDADDLMNKVHIESMVKAANGSETDLVACSWARFYKDNALNALPVNNCDALRMDPMAWIKRALAEKYDMVPGWFWLIPRKLLERTGGWDERLSLNNDFEFSIRLALNSYAIRCAREAILYYRSGNEQSLSANHTKESYRAAILSAHLGGTQLLEKENSALTRRLYANKLSFWLYQIYPNHPELLMELEQEIKKLGGCDRKIDDSRFMHLLQCMLGWKAAKRIKRAMYEIGYDRHLLPLKKKYLSL